MTAPLLLDGTEHHAHDPNCPECWQGYPRPCQCGGLIHADYGDETDDGYWLYKTCDECSSYYEEAED